VRAFLALCAVAAAALFALPDTANATVVTWSFYETSCTPDCIPFTRPLATLTLSGPTSSGYAEWNVYPIPPTLEGDTDFTFTPAAGDMISPPDYGNTPDCEGSDTAVCRYEIGWVETDGQLNGFSLYYLTASVEFRDFGLTGGIIVSDPGFGGCPSGTTCIVTGVWRSDLPVSEPGSAILLLSGILGFGAARRQKTIAAGQ
jgi:hypothetical protein